MDSLAKDPHITPSSDFLPTAETPLLPRYHPSSPPSAPSSSPHIGQDQAFDVAHDPPSSCANADAIPTRNPTDSQVAPDAKRHLFLPTVLLCGFLNLVADLGGNMTAAPEIRILELSLCRDYFRAHDPSVIGPPPWRFVDERHCKIAEVQSQLAQLRGLRAPFAELITEFVSPPIGAALMRTNVWLAFAVSIPVILLSYPVIAAIPETLAPTAQPIDARPSRASIESDCERRALTKVGRFTLYISRANDPNPKVVHRFSGHLSELSYKTLELVKIPSVALSLAIYLLDAWAVQSSSLLLQFASERLHWSLGRSAYLLSIRAAVALLLTLVILPVLNQYLFRSLQLQPFKIDAMILRISFLASCFGYLLIGGSNSQGLLILGCIVSSGGSNAPQTLQGLTSSFTNGSNTAELYSTLAFAQLVGTLLGGPIAAALFTLGLRLGPDTPWAGLPFYASSDVVHKHRYLMPQE
ncbi:MAG: hypothetical protein Q9173_004252 [Seirophora scorigena]